MSTKDTLPKKTKGRSMFENIARKGSGARLNSQQYREWYAKVKRHDILEKENASLRTRLDAAEKELADADLLLGLEWRQAIKAVNGDPVAAKELIIAQLVGDLAEAKEANAELVKTINTFGDKATDVFEQMLKGHWVDDHGHDVTLNQAMYQLKNVVVSVLNQRAIDAAAAKGTQ